MAPSSASDDGSESEQNDLRLRKPIRENSLEKLEFDVKIKVGLDNNNNEYVEFSGDAPLLWHQPIERRRMGLSDFRRALGYSDIDFDEYTAASQSHLRANAPYDPTRLANRSLVHPRARVESHISPGEPQCYRVVPQLLSTATASRPNILCEIDLTFERDHRGGFLVYKIAPTGKWSLLHALVAALTILHPSFKFSALDLYYYYSKAAESRGTNRVNAAAHNCVFDWGIADLAICYYLKDLGLPTLLTFVVVQPLDDKTTFTIAQKGPDWSITPLQRLWLMYTKNEDPHQSHFNVVMRPDTEMSPLLINSLDALESQQSWEYNDGIRLLEAELTDRYVPMTSLTLNEIRLLFIETDISRFEHMNYLSDRAHRRRSKMASRE